MGEVSKKVVLETVSTAKDYFLKLQDLIKSIEEAEDQVLSSCTKTLAEIDATFDMLKSTVIEALDRRRKVLKGEATKISDEGLVPLRACRDVVNEKLKTTMSYINDGNEILRIGGAKSEESARIFSEKASLLGSLPAVPSLEEVPSISFQSNADIFKFELEFNATSVGRVSRMGPVQVTCIEPKPGALLVHWEEVDQERPVDISCFRLQSAYGDVRDHADHIESNSHDVYVGPESRHLVRNLEAGAPYTFRTCCRAEGDADWSAWSLPVVATTDMPPFAWDRLNSNYMVTNEGKIATKATTTLSTLYSNAPQFGPGHSIEFTILECGAHCSDEGLGLSVVRTQIGHLDVPGTLFLSTIGAVFVDGREKTTRLPPLAKGAKVCFTCEHIRDSRIRVNIDSCNKSVTYDWDLEDSCGDVVTKLYFAVRFGESTWKVLVE